MDLKPNFQIPNEAQCEKAFGDISYLTQKEQQIFQILTNYQIKIKKPKNGDWLADHKEYGQSFEKFCKEIVKADTKKKFMYIIPLEKEINKEFLEKLKIMCEAFYYGFKVKIMDYPDLQKWNIDSRINEYSNIKQYNASQLLDKMLYIKPRDAYCVIAVTMTDLYPQPEWNFVFGLADMYSQMGVFSFARYNDNFYDPKAQPDQDLIFYRSCKVMLHEFGHQYKMKHCIYNQCIMNGSNNLEENAQKPMNLCTICLKKVHKVLNFDILERFIALYKACNDVGNKYFLQEAQFIKQIIDNLEQKIYDNKNLQEENKQKDNQYKK